MRHKDLTGQKFNMLTVKTFAFIRDSHAYWNCVCDCGKESVVCASRLLRGTTKSCGCLIKTTPRPRGKRVYIRTVEKDRLYNIFMEMKKRCYNSNCRSYKDYGARGIAICNEWLCNPKLFRLWSLTNGYRDDLTIDRINVNGNYEPNNCRWVSAKKQANNRRSNLLITFEGKTMSAAEWCELKGWNRHVIPARLKSGWSLEKAMTTPLKTKGGKK